MTRNEMHEYNNSLRIAQQKKTVLVFKKISLSLTGSEILSLNFILSLIATFLLLPHTFIPDNIKIAMAVYVGIVQVIWWNTKVIIYPFLDDTDYYINDLLVHRKDNTPAYVSKTGKDQYSITVLKPEKQTIDNLSYEEVENTYYYVLPNSSEFQEIKSQISIT